MRLADALDILIEERKGAVAKRTDPVWDERGIQYVYKARQGLYWTAGHTAGGPVKMRQLAHQMDNEDWWYFDHFGKTDSIREDA